MKISMADKRLLRQVAHRWSLQAQLRAYERHLAWLVAEVDGGRMDVAAASQLETPPSAANCCRCGQDVAP